MMSALLLEFYKIRRKKIGGMITLFLSAEMLWAFLSISRSIAKNPDNAGWESIIFSVASMNGLFLPIISAIVVSRICDMEHKGSTWKMLMATNVRRGQLYAAKYGCAVTLLLYGIVAQVGLMIAFGLAKGIAEPLPAELIIRFIGGTLLTTLAITALQQWLSLAIRNQAFALCLGMLGGFIGTTASLFPAAARQLFIWSYYTDLSPVTYVYAEAAGTFVVQNISTGLLVAALFMSLIFYTAGSIHTARREL
ncbi:ABC transporter permease [Paenibacillaceae bacterium]|nr:ABC transporter permease [Paenibacillaceae bacterium]